MIYKYLNDDGLKAYTKKVKTAIANAIAEVKLYFTTQKVTWSELKALRDAKKLVAGKTYRITDFVTTSVQADTRSAGHAFDLLVVADDEGTLNENARAVLHSGDTYFAHSKLSAWKLKYCLDNDTNRFAWADATNGKGVVWWMKDEWNNECFYDFKNIQYKLYAGTGNSWGQYLQTLGVSAEDIIPYRLTKGLSEAELGKYLFGIDNDNFIWAYTWSAYEDAKQTFDKSLKADGTKDVYDDIVHDCKVGANWETLQQDDETVYSRISLNFYIAIPFFLDSKDESFRTYSVKIGENCHDIVTGRKCHSNSFGNNCHSNSFGNDCHSNSFEDDCYSNSFGNSCSSNSFGNNYSSNSFGNSCHSNSFGNSCYSNSFGNDCSYNSFGNSCYYNSFGNNCNSNSFGNICYSNSFGNDCSYNSFENDCYYNSFGSICYSNSFGNDCSSNSFGNDCSSNSFGNDCNYNSFGNNCNSNSFGNNCNSNSFGNSTEVDFQCDFIQYMDVGNGVKFVVIAYDEQATKPSANAPLKNITIKSGVAGTEEDKILLNRLPLNLDYEWTIAKNSSGVVKQYCEADLIK